MRDLLKGLEERSKTSARGAISWALVLLGIMGLPTDILAQDIMTEFKPLEINVHVSMLFLGDSRISDRADPATGARFVYHLPGGLGFGGSFDWTRGGIDHRLEEVPEQLFLVNDVLFYGGEIGYTFGRDGRFQYFLGSGLGGATIRQAEREPGNEIRTNTFVHVPIGGGLKILDSLSDPSFAFRIDLRDHIVWIGEPEDREVFLRNEGAIDNVELSGGISFLFDGP